jgi:hypothetical protein
MRNTCAFFLLCGLALIALSGCGGSEPSEGLPPSTMPGSPPPKRAPVTDTATAVSPDEIALKTGLRVVVGSRLRGLPTADKYKLTLTSWQLGPAGVDFTDPLHRSGSVTVSEQALESGRAFIAPFFLDTAGPKSAQGPLIWLSRSVYRELHETGASSIAPATLSGGAGTPIAITKTGTDTHALKVLDREVRVPVMKAEDAEGTQYEILDTPANPLVVSVRYSAKSKVGGQQLPDTLTAGSGYDVLAVESGQEAKPGKPTERFPRPQRSVAPANGTK